MYCSTPVHLEEEKNKRFERITHSGCVRKEKKKKGGKGARSPDARERLAEAPRRRCAPPPPRPRAHVGGTVKFWGGEERSTPHKNKRKTPRMQSFFRAHSLEGNICNIIREHLVSNYLRILDQTIH